MLFMLHVMFFLRVMCTGRLFISLFFLHEGLFFCSCILLVLLIQTNFMNLMLKCFFLHSRTATLTPEEATMSTQKCEVAKTLCTFTTCCGLPQFSTSLPSSWVSSQQQYLEPSRTWQNWHIAFTLCNQDTCYLLISQNAYKSIIEGRKNTLESIQTPLFFSILLY